MKRILVIGLIAITMIVGAFAVNANAANTNDFSSERDYGHRVEKSEKSNSKIDLNNQEEREIRNERREDGCRIYCDDRDNCLQKNEFRGGHCHGRKTGKKHGHGMGGRKNY